MDSVNYSLTGLSTGITVSLYRMGDSGHITRPLNYLKHRHEQLLTDAIYTGLHTPEPLAATIPIQRKIPVPGSPAQCQKQTNLRPKFLKSRKNESFSCKIP